MPSRDSTESDDDTLLASELRLAHLRSQVAVVRTIADQVEQLARARDAESLRTQLVEEMARLGCRLLEAAAAFTEVPHGEDSAVFVRPLISGDVE
jgi:hypothetical protein